MSPDAPASKPKRCESQPLFAYVLDEMSLVSFLWRAICGVEISLIAIRPISPQAKRLLERVAAWAMSRYRVRWTIEYTPELIKDWRWNRNLYFRNVYGKYEPWQDSYFKLPWAGGEVDDFGYAFNHLTANYVYDKSIEIFAIDALDRAMTGRDVIKIGFSRDTTSLFAAFFKAPLTHLKRRSTMMELVVNVLVSGVAILAGMAWMVRRLRWRTKPEPVFCIVDRLGNPQEELLIDAVRDGGKVVSFDRSGGNISGQHVRWGDGSVGLMDFPRCAVTYVFRIVKLFFRHRGVTPRHFCLVAALPRKAMLWRGLLNLYLPRHFIGRDEYNSDHVLRGGELARMGAKSHGISGAVYAAYTDVAPNSRYVAYDHLYVVGTKVIIPERWRQSMAVHPIGSWGFPSERLRQQSPPGDHILITVRIAFEIDEMVRITHAVAAAFPAKIVIVQMKPVTFLSASDLEDLSRRYRDDYPNIVMSDEPVYDLVNRAKYHISDISSLVAESIHRGAYCFVADVLGHESCCYREIPGLCVETAADAVSRLMNIEKGETRYPREEYMERIGLPFGTDPFDVIRGQLGLEPRPAFNPVQDDNPTDAQHRKIVSAS